jgi:hypothetical protein
MARKGLIGVILLLMTILCPIASAYSVSPAKWEVYMYEDYEITPQTKLSINVDNTHNTSISIRLSVYSDPKKQRKDMKPYRMNAFIGYGLLKQISLFRQKQNIMFQW